MTQAYLCIWWCALVAFLSNELTAQPLQDFLPNLCDKKSDDLYPHPFKCHAFIRCHKGVAWEQECSPNLHFNPQTKACDYPYIVKCSTAFQKDTRRPNTVTDDSGSVNDQQYPNDQNTNYRGEDDQNRDTDSNYERDRDYQNQDTENDYDNDHDYPKPPSSKEYEYSQEKQDQNRGYDTERGFGGGSHENNGNYPTVRENPKNYKKPPEKNKYGQDYDYREEVPTKRENTNSNYKDLERVRYPTRRRPYLKESGFEFQGLRQGNSRSQVPKENVQFNRNDGRQKEDQSSGRGRTKERFDASFKRPGGDPLMHSQQNKPFFADNKVTDNEPFTRNSGQMSFLHGNTNSRQNVFGTGNTYKPNQSNGANNRNENPTFQPRQQYNTRTQGNDFTTFKSQPRNGGQYPRNPQPKNEDYGDKEFYETGHNERQQERHHTNRDGFDPSRSYESRSLIKIKSQDRQNKNLYNNNNNFYRSPYQNELDQNDRQQADDREKAQYEKQQYGYENRQQPEGETTYNNKPTGEDAYGNQQQYETTENGNKKNRFYPQYNARAANTASSDSYPLYSARAANTDASDSYPLHSARASNTASSDSYPLYSARAANTDASDSYPLHSARASNTATSDAYPLYQKQDQREYNDDDSSRYQPQAYQRGNNGYQQRDRFYDSIPGSYGNESYYNPYSAGHMNIPNTEGKPRRPNSYDSGHMNIPNTERKPRRRNPYPGSVEQSQERHPHQENGHQKNHNTQLSGRELEIPNQLFRQGGRTYSTDTTRSRKSQKPPDFDAFPSTFLPGNFVGPRYGALALSDMSKLEDFDKTRQRTFPKKVRSKELKDMMSDATKQNKSTQLNPLIQKNSPVSYREVDPETDQWTEYKEFTHKRSKRSIDWLELALYTEDEPDTDHLETKSPTDQHHGKVFQVYASYGSGKKNRGLAASIGYGETVHGHHDTSTPVSPSTGQIVHATLTDPLVATKKFLTNKITRNPSHSVNEEKGSVLFDDDQNSNETVLNSSRDTVNQKQKNKMKKDFTEKDLHVLIHNKSGKNKKNLEDPTQSNENLYGHPGKFYQRESQDYIGTSGKVLHGNEFENNDETRYKKKQEFFETEADHVKTREKHENEISYPKYKILDSEKGNSKNKKKPFQPESEEGDEEFQNIYDKKDNRQQADGYAPPIGPLFKKNFVQFDMPMVLGIKTPMHPPENEVPIPSGMFESRHIHVTHHFKPTSSRDLTETDHNMGEHRPMKDHGIPNPYDRDQSHFSYNGDTNSYVNFLPQRMTGFSYLPLEFYNTVNRNPTLRSYQRQPRPPPQVRSYPRQPRPPPQVRSYTRQPRPPPQVYQPIRKPVYRQNNRPIYKNTFRSTTYKQPNGYRNQFVARKPFYPEIGHHFNQFTPKSYGYNNKLSDVNHHVHGMGKEAPPSYVLNLIRRIHPGYPGLPGVEFENRSPTRQRYQSEYGPRTQKLRSSTASQRPRVEDMRGYLGEAMHSAKSIVRKRIRDETDMYHRMSHVVDSKPFQYVASFLGGKPYAKHLSHSGMAIIDVLKQMEKKYDISGTDVVKMVGDFSSEQYLKPMSTPTRADTRFPITPDIDFCPYPTHYICEEEYRYRTIDGACNNLKSPILGRSMTPYKRLLPAHYGDGIEEMRLSFNGGALPGARFISLNQFLDVDRPNSKHTLMLMVWGQFLDHDFTRTAITKVAKDDGEMGDTEEVKCGFDGCTTDQPGLDSCWPIPVPDEDPDFRYNRCLKFVRSQEVPHLSCQLAPREQLNQVTSWIDASMIYGSTKEESEDLRDFSHPGRGGMLITPHPQGSQYKPLLPQNDFELCRDVNATIRCFKAGDERVNEQVSLTIMHTMWVREHNRIEGALNDINPHWDGERLFQETRKIVAGMIQHIAFTEYIPDILGREILEHYDLVMQRTGYFYGYDQHADPRVANSFAAAAFRFGHTLVQERFHRADNSYNYDDRLILSETFRRPKFIYETQMGGIDSLTRGLVDKPAQSYDPFFTKQISRSLFTEKPPFGPGMDLLSLNLMRGRDHGIPGYNEFRKFCGLPPARDFDDLSREIPSVAVRNVLKKIYRSVHDIDLFAGGVAEKSVKGGVVGPTFGCIIARQFRDLRVGDRFWYENDHEHGFTPAQLQEIRKSRLARVMCANSDNIDRIQPWVLLNPTSSHPYGDAEGDNPFVPCDQIPELDLRKWRHGPNTA